MTKATVNERKFNGTATLDVFAESRNLAVSAARQFWREEHGSNPSKIIAQEDDGLRENCWNVMVSDHSSGSLADTKEYEY